MSEERQQYWMPCPYEWDVDSNTHRKQQEKDWYKRVAHDLVRWSRENGHSPFDLRDVEPLLLGHIANQPSRVTRKRDPAMLLTIVARRHPGLLCGNGFMYTVHPDIIRQET